MKQLLLWALACAWVPSQGADSSRLRAAHTQASVTQTSESNGNIMALLGLGSTLDVVKLNRSQLLDLEEAITVLAELDMSSPGMRDFVTEVLNLTENVLKVDILAASNATEQELINARSLVSRCAVNLQGDLVVPSALKDGLEGNKNDLEECIRKLIIAATGSTSGLTLEEWNWDWGNPEKYACQTALSVGAQAAQEAKAAGESPRQQALSAGTAACTACGAADESATKQAEIAGEAAAAVVPSAEAADRASWAGEAAAACAGNASLSLSPADQATLAGAAAAALATKLNLSPELQAQYAGSAATAAAAAAGLSADDQATLASSAAGDAATAAGASSASVALLAAEASAASQSTNGAATQSNEDVAATAGVAAAEAAKNANLMEELVVELAGQAAATAMTSRSQVSGSGTADNDEIARKAAAAASAAAWDAAKYTNLCAEDLDKLSRKAGAVAYSKEVYNGAIAGGQNISEAIAAAGAAAAAWGQQNSSSVAEAAFFAVLSASKVAQAAGLSREDQAQAAALAGMAASETMGGLSAGEVQTAIATATGEAACREAQQSGKSVEEMARAAGKASQLALKLTASTTVQDQVDGAADAAYTCADSLGTLSKVDLALLVGSVAAAAGSANGWSVSVSAEAASAAAKAAALSAGLSSGEAEEAGQSAYISSEALAHAEHAKEVGQTIQACCATAGEKACAGAMGYQWPLEEMVAFAGEVAASFCTSSGSTAENAAAAAQAAASLCYESACQDCTASASSAYGSLARSAVYATTTQMPFTADGGSQIDPSAISYISGSDASALGNRVCDDNVITQVCTEAQQSCQVWIDIYGKDLFNSHPDPDENFCDLRNWTSVGQHLNETYKYWLRMLEDFDQKKAACDSQASKCECLNQEPCFVKDWGPWPEGTTIEGRLKPGCYASNTTSTTTTTSTTSSSSSSSTTSSPPSPPVSCQALQRIMDVNACKHCKGAKVACDSFTSCFDTLMPGYNKTWTRICGPGGEREGYMSEYYGVLRIECLVRALNASDQTRDAEIDKCKHKTSEYYKLVVKPADILTCYLPHPQDLSRSLPACTATSDIATYTYCSGTQPYNNYFYQWLQNPAPCESTCCTELPADHVPPVFDASTLLPVTTNPYLNPTWYDCENDTANWETTWSQQKRSWCWTNAGVGGPR